MGLMGPMGPMGTHKSHRSHPSYPSHPPNQQQPLMLLQSSHERQEQGRLTHRESGAAGDRLQLIADSVRIPLAEEADLVEESPGVGVEMLEQLMRGGIGLLRARS